MSMIAGDIKDLLTISFKSRHDTFTDQYNRMFMLKLLLACAIVTGISWYSDKINCILPDDMSESDDFQTYVASTCWIQGVYIYSELAERFNKVAYYGIPKDIRSDGLRDDQYLCFSKGAFHWSKKACVEMTKKFYVQYQWLPFFLGAMALMYYIPYMMYRRNNHDFILLSRLLESKPVSTVRVLDKFFVQARVSGLRNWITGKHLMNFFIKILYIFVNALCFYSSNKIFEGNFYDYGPKWINWGKSNNTIKFDYMGAREFPKPGNELLPPFGFCELYAQSKDVKHSYNNQHKLLCELSQHILYQYAFIVLWFAIIIGIVLSVVGFLLAILKYVLGTCRLCQLKRKNDMTRRIFEHLTYRQLEYLNIIRKDDIALYGELMDELAERRKQFDDARGGVERRPILENGFPCCCIK